VLFKFKLFGYHHYIVAWAWSRVSNCCISKSRRRKKCFGE